MRCLALFDFDGTLTFKDSLADFIAYAVGRSRLVSGAAFLSPFLAAYALKIMDNGQAKRKVLSHFFAGWREDVLEAAGKAYALERLPKILRDKGIDRLYWHLDQGHDVAIVSASPEVWLRAWTENMGIGLIGTSLEVKDGRITGNYQGRNCHGEEKVRRIKERYPLEEYDIVYAYGDTSGDTPMLGLAHEVVYKPFR